MINKEIMKMLCERIGKTRRRVYQLIEKKKKDYGYTITNEMAAYLLAADYDIDLSEILPEEELTRLRMLRETKTVVKENVKKMPSKITTIEISKEFRVIDPFLPQKIIDEAKEMSKVYPIVYLFENSVRNLIRIVLEKKYGSNWWSYKVPPSIQREVQKRLEQEKKNRWHGKRGAHPIFYTDIEDLSSIIVTNWNDFKELFPNQEWIKVRISEIELTRNTIAHNNPLSKRDIQRLKIYFQDWINQIKGYKVSTKMDKEEKYEQ
jgi:hypothetical protein